MPYATRESCRTFRQRVYLYLYTWSHNLLLHLHIAGTSIKEGLKRIYMTVLLYDDALEGDTRDLQFTRHLGEHHILAPRRGLIRPAVKRLNGERLLRRKGYFLSIETFQVGHITTQACQPHKRIHLVG